MNLAERRMAERFTGAIPIELKQGMGLTRDFSTDGIYFETDQPLAVGEELDFFMHLELGNPANPLRIRCQGEVVRLEPGLEWTGVAVAIAAHLY